MEEFHDDDLDDDIVGSGFVRGSGEFMVLFVEVNLCLLFMSAVQLGFQSFCSR